MRAKGCIAAVLLVGLTLGMLTPAFAGSGPLAAARGPTPSVAPFSIIPPTATAASAWSLLGTQAPARDGPGWVYDSRADRFIVFGGSTATAIINSTWSYDYANSTWANITPTVGPSPRVGMSMVYDSRADRVVLFGGTSGYPVTFGDTWIFDYANRTWTNVTTASHPSARVAAAADYDAVADRVILFGGSTSTAFLADTWAYAYATNTWSLQSASGAPSGRFYASMAYDSVDHVSLLFGGAGISGFSAVFFNDTFTYSYASAAWTQLSSAGAPEGRYGAAMAYDPLARRAIVFGGANGLTVTATYYNDTWALGVSPASWANLTPIHSPSQRSDAGLAYDVKADRMVLLGGFSPTLGPLDDAWAYTFGAATPSAPRFLDATPAANEVMLSWLPPTSDGASVVTNYSIYRGTTSGGETLLVTVGLALSYTVTAVIAGTTYYYEVSAVNAVGTGPKSNEVHATPTAPDTTPPMIAITVPANNSILTSVDVTVNGTASDDVAVAYVQVSTDGSTWTNASGTATWSAKLTLVEGTNTIYARAFDTSGNKAGAQVTVTVQPASAGPLGLSPGVWLALIVVVVAVVAVIAFLVLLRRRKPQAPQVVPPPAPPTTIAPAQPAPPAPSPPQPPPAEPPGPPPSGP